MIINDLNFLIFEFIFQKILKLVNFDHFFPMHTVAYVFRL
jgi:hypothetical protein